MTFQIRDAVAEDLDAMWQISVRAHQDNYGTFIPKDRQTDFDARYSLTSENKQKYNEKFQQYLLDRNWFIWVATVDNKVVGYTLAHKENEHLLHKKGLFMDPAYQSQGIGSALFAISLTPIEKGEIDLSVITANSRARHIYEKHGFQAS